MSLVIRYLDQPSIPMVVQRSGDRQRTAALVGAAAERGGEEIGRVGKYTLNNTTFIVNNNFPNYLTLCNHKRLLPSN